MTADRATTLSPDRSIGSRAISAVLRHPGVMAIKGMLKNTWWAIKGRRYRNPPLPPQVGSILFVCLGNICRSPFAAHLAERRLAVAGRADIRCASAGINTRQSGRVPTEGRAVAEDDFGLVLEAHRPQLLTAELAVAHDLIVVMEAGQLAWLRVTYPELVDRVVLLPLFDPAPAAAHQRYHIDDPFLQPRAAFQACYQRIDRALTPVLVAVSSSPRRS